MWHCAVRHAGNILEEFQAHEVGECHESVGECHESVIFHHLSWETSTRRACMHVRMGACVCVYVLVCLCVCACVRA